MTDLLLQLVDVFEKAVGGQPAWVPGEVFPVVTKPLPKIALIGIGPAVAALVGLALASLSHALAQKPGIDAGKCLLARFRSEALR